MSKACRGTRKRTAPQRFDFYWRMMADTDLSPTAKCVAAALLFKFHNAKSSRCNPGAASIARTAGLARRTVFYAIVELKDAGWITVESTKGGSASHTNQYGFDFKRVKSASPPTGAQDAPPTGAQDAPVHEMGGRGAQFAHEPLRTTRPSGGGWGEENSDCRAPDGAAEKEEEADASHGHGEVGTGGAVQTTLRVVAKATGHRPGQGVKGVPSGLRRAQWR